MSALVLNILQYPPKNWTKREMLGLEAYARVYVFDDHDTRQQLVVKRSGYSSPFTLYVYVVQVAKYHSNVL